MGFKEKSVFLKNRLPLRSNRRDLALFYHHPSTAAADPGMSTALRFLGLLGRARLAKRRIHARLHRLATKYGEKRGLTAESLSIRLLQGTFRYGILFFPEKHRKETFPGLLDIPQLGKMNWNDEEAQH